jgi:hypothetical protein
VVAWSVQNRDLCRGEPGNANHARPGRLEVPPSTLVRWVNVPTARHKSEMIGSRSVFIAEMTCSSPIVGRRLRCAAVYSSSWLLS